MALSTLLGRARSDYYRQLSAYESDVRLLYENCLAYNEPASDIVKAAQRMQAELLGRRAAERRAGRADGAIAESDDAAVGSAEPTTRAGGALGDESRESALTTRMRARWPRRPPRRARSRRAPSPLAGALRDHDRARNHRRPRRPPRRPRRRRLGRAAAPVLRMIPSGAAPPARTAPVPSLSLRPTTTTRTRITSPGVRARSHDAREPGGVGPRYNRADRPAPGPACSGARRRLLLLGSAVAVPARALAVRVRVGGASCEPDGDSAEMSDAEDYCWHSRSTAYSRGTRGPPALVCLARPRCPRQKRGGQLRGRRVAGRALLRRLHLLHLARLRLEAGEQRAVILEQRLRRVAPRFERRRRLHSLSLHAGAQRLGTMFRGAAL